MNEEDRLYGLNLHDKTYFKSIDAWIIRVPNGWIYQFINSEMDKNSDPGNCVIHDNVMSSIFIEYSSDYYPG